MRAENLRVNEEANGLRGEQTKHLASIAEQQEELTKLQAALNKLQVERNESLGKIADNTAKTATTAERNAVRLRKYFGQIVYVTEGASNWGAMGWEIAEVNEDNILQLFTPVGYQSSRAMGICVDCDKLHIVEVPMGGCPVQIKVLERYGAAIDYGEAQSWAERGGTPKLPCPRGNNLFHEYRKGGIAAKRGIYIYDSADGSPFYSLVTFDNMKETGVYCCQKSQVEKKFSLLQVEWYGEGWRYGGSGPGNLILFTK